MKYLNSQPEYDCSDCYRKCLKLMLFLFVFIRIFSNISTVNKHFDGAVQKLAGAQGVLLRVS